MSDPGLNPPFKVTHDKSMSKRELFEYHLKQGMLDLFYEQYPEDRPWYYGRSGGGRER